MKFDSHISTVLIGTFFVVAQTRADVAFSAEQIRYSKEVNTYTNSTEVIIADFQSKSVYYKRGKAYVKAGNYQQAIVDFTKYINLAPQDKNGYYQRGFAFYKLNAHRKAISDYTRAINIDSNYADAYLNRGFAYYEIGRITDAIEDLQQASSTYKAISGFHLALAIALDKQGKESQAISLAKKVIDNDARVKDLNFLIRNNWGSNLVSDAQAFFEKLPEE